MPALRPVALRASLDAVLSQVKTRLDALSGASQLASQAENVLRRDQAFAAARAELQERKASFDGAMSKRSTVQQELTTLLQRKPAWTSSDVGRFTELLRLEHDAQASEAAALQQLRSSEAGVDSKLVAYAEALRERYQQEQEYAATSRTMATWGTWVLLGVNTLLFSANVLIFEPRKQRRAEERMRGVIAESGEDIVRRLAPPMDDAAEDDSHSRRPPPPPPLISPEVAVAAVVQAALSDAEQRRAAVDHRLEQRMEALAKAVEKAIPSAAVAAATGARSQDGSVRGRLRRAWTAVPLLNEVLRRQDEWPLAVLGVAATGGFVAGLLASALSGR